MRNYNLCLLLMVISVVMLKVSGDYSGLKVGYYSKTCPSAEKIVKEVVGQAVKKNPGVGAGLIRMHFHDCFVRGCDASVLLDSIPGIPAEKESIPNNPSLRGFDVIDLAKKKLERSCPAIVSCADIIAFAARDSAKFSGGITYEVPAGRLDGKISISDEVLINLPAPFHNSSVLIDIFSSKGLSVEDLVLLSGAHSIGRSHCTSFATRLYNFTGKGDQDPSLDRDFAAYLKRKCPPAKLANGDDPVVLQDVVTPKKLDNQYYKNVKDGKVLFTSDWTLVEDARTSSFVEDSARNGGAWEEAFGKAMVKMGLIDVRTAGGDGEVRLNCRKVNY